MMTDRKLFRILLIFFILLSSGIYGCDSKRTKVFVPKEEDTLPYLVNHSDIIAVITISGGWDISEVSGENAKPEFKEKVKAEINEIYLNKTNYRESLKDIILYTSPSNSKKGTLSTTFFRNGRNLAFLKHKGNNAFSPTTGFSVSDVRRNEKIYPVWVESLSGTENFPEFTLDEIKRKISEISTAP